MNEVLTDGTGKWELQSLDDTSHSAKIAGKTNFLSGNNEIELSIRLMRKTEIELIRPNSTDSMVKLTSIKIIDNKTIEAASQQGDRGIKKKLS